MKKNRFLSQLDRIVYGNVPSEDTKLRFLLTVYFYGGFCGIVATLSNSILGLDPTGNYAVFVMGILFFILHRFLFRRKISYTAGFRFFYLFSALCFNILWFFNGGINGAIVIFYYLLVIVIMIYSEGWERAFNLFLVMFNIFCLMYVDYNYPELITQYPSDFARYLDMYVSILICLFVNYIAISVVLTALKKANKELQDKYISINRDLKLASKIQYSVMPIQYRVEGFELASIYKPLTEVGGDIFSIDERGDGKIRIFLADATGHGVQAGLVTMLILSEYISQKSDFDSPGDLVSVLNEIFIQKFSDIKAIFPCLVLDWDRSTNQISYASAGQIPQFLVRQHEVFDLEKTGPIIGLKKGIQYPTKNLSILDGDTLLLFTDGLTEAFDVTRSMYGDVRLGKFIMTRSVDTYSLNGYLSLMYEDLLNFIGNVELQDDLTVVAIRKNTFSQNESISVLT